MYKFIVLLETSPVSVRPPVVHCLQSNFGKGDSKAWHGSTFPFPVAFFFLFFQSTTKKTSWNQSIHLHALSSSLIIRLLFLRLLYESSFSTNQKGQALLQLCSSEQTIVRKKEPGTIWTPQLIEQANFHFVQSFPLNCNQWFVKMTPITQTRLQSTHMQTSFIRHTFHRPHAHSCAMRLLAVSYNKAGLVDVRFQNCNTVILSTA